MSRTVFHSGLLSACMIPKQRHIYVLVDVAPGGGYQNRLPIFLKIERMGDFMATIKLQGIYERKTAIPAAELKPGMVTIWNFEFTETVKSVVPTKSGKSVKCVIISDESGKEYTRTMRKDRLVAVAI